MEAATVAWHHMGWTPVGFSEIEPFPSQILKHHYPTIPNYGDLTKFKEWPIERGAVDLLVGGTPCQAFSVAGLRQGLADPRGNLALTFLALADHLRPKYILWENVPGVLSSSGGEDFASFISALAELRYGFAWRVCDAQYFGVPQRRKRVFLLAIEGAGNWRTAAEVLSLSKGLSGYIEKGDKKRKKPATNAGTSVEANGKGVAFRKSKRACSTTDNETWVEGDVSNTLNNFDLGDTRTTHAVVYENHPNDSRVTGPHDVAPTVVSRFGTGGGNVPFVNQEPKPLMFKIRGGCETNTGEQGGVIGQSAGKGYLGSEDKTFTVATTQDQWLATTEPITFQPGNLRRHAGADPSTETTTTLKATSGDQMPHIAYAQGVDLYNQALTGDLHCPLRTAGGHGAPAVMAFDAFNQTVSKTSKTLTCAASDVNHVGAVYSPTMAVRRLTPKECERLQGFPDDYSMIPWNKKPAELCPDGPRYKACGNSMAVPVMRWIGERIQKYVDGILNK